MFVSNIENIFLIFNISKWLGVFPFTINAEGCFQTSLRHLLLSIMIFLPIFIHNVSIIVNLYAYAFGHSWLSLLVCCVDSLGYTFYPLVSVAELFFKLKEFNQSINIIKLVSNVMYPVGIISFPYNRTHFIADIVLFTFMFICDSWTYFFVILDVKQLLIYTIRFWLLFLIAVLIDRFSSIVGTLTSLFKLCNDELLLSAPTSTTRTKRLERLAWAHDQLCDCSDLISEVHSLQTFHIINVCLLGSVLEIFEIGDLIFSGSCNFAIVVTFLCWLSFNVCILWQMVDSCSKCGKEAKKFNTLLYQLMIDDETNEISENKKLRLHISMKREVVFSACGFFNLDYTLIHSMVAAATTYLVILIQFGQPLNSGDQTEHPNSTLTSSSDVSNYFTTPSWTYTTL